MNSGFNHVNILVGDEFTDGIPYDVTEQVSADIFGNHKVLYCTINFSESFRNKFGFIKSVGVMSVLDGERYIKSDILRVAGNTIFISFVLIGGVSGGVYRAYLVMNYGTI